MTISAGTGEPVTFHGSVNEPDKTATNNVESHKIADRACLGRQLASPVWRDRVLGQCRSTPTRVGTTRPAEASEFAFPVHPHARGDDFSVRTMFPPPNGSPQRAWGRHWVLTGHQTRWIGRMHAEVFSRMRGFWHQS
jgi:hypothetical protein